jgi:hypothetical protein
VDSGPRPRFVRADDALVKSDKLLDFCRDEAVDADSADVAAVNAATRDATGSTVVAGTGVMGISTSCRAPQAP